MDDRTWRRARRRRFYTLPRHRFDDLEAFVIANTLITKWNILALGAAIIGGTATLGLDQLWLQAWASSGKRFPIAQQGEVELPAGVSHVWYESSHSLPTVNVGLHMVQADREVVIPERLGPEVSYRLLLGGRSGRALWRLNMPRSGRYQFTCFNNNFESVDQIPSDDHVVFLKTPDTLAQASIGRKLIQVTGATATGTAVIVLYLVHALELRKRQSAAKALQTA